MCPEPTAEGLSSLVQWVYWFLKNYEFSLRSFLEKHFLLVCSTGLMARATPSALRHEVNLGGLKEKQHLLRPGACCCFPVRHGAKELLLSEGN